MSAGSASRPARRTADGDDPDQRLLRTFLELVRIDSPSGFESEIASYVIEQLRSIGVRTYVDDSAYDADSNTGNVIGELNATVPGMTIVLCAHLDTVEPGRGIEPVVKDGIVSSSGRTILGADDKAGVAAIIEALRRLRETGAPHGCVRVLLTVGEERGLKGAKALKQKDAAGDLCLVLDADGRPGGIVTCAPTHYTFSATFHGRAAHAGVEPEKGISAVQMASRAIASMRLGRIDDDTTANIGQVNGGGATNVIASSCYISGECRSLDGAKVESVRKEMDDKMRAAAAGLGGKVTVAWTKEYDGFQFSDSDPALLMVEESVRALGLHARRFRTGGGSDGNVLAAKGLPSLVLSSGMTNVHGTDETMAVHDLHSLVGLLLAVIARATR